MSTTSSDPLSKDRKRSAHWTDEDTDTLVNLLLRHRDTGRTADNGFKPEVWTEASILLKPTTHVGGPKTPDACKSRWQRLQRDYKAAKDMQAMPGFSWDRENHRLAASTEAWEQAEKHVDGNKYRKIHLPCYDALASLCLVDGSRSRPRISKGRSSMGSISNSSSMLSLSTNTNNPNGAGPSQQQQPSSSSATATHGQMNHHSMGTINGHQQQHQQQQQQQQPDNNSASDASAMASLHGQLQGENGVFNWGGNEGGDDDGQGEFETSFTMHDGSQTFNLGQKRPISFDPSILAGMNVSANHNNNHNNTASQNPSSHTLSLQQQQQQGSPPKKPRQSRQGPQVTQRNSARSQQDTQLHPRNTNSNQAQNQNHSTHQATHTLPAPHTHPQSHPQFYQMPSHPQAQSSTSAHPSRNQPVSASNSAILSGGNSTIVPRSPDFSNTSSLLDPHVLQTPPGLTGNPNGNILRHFNPNTNTNTNTNTNANPNGSGPGPGPGLPQSISLTSLSSLSAEVITAGLTEAQRRTEAIIQLQNQENDTMSDQDLVEVMAEFEGNVAAADTYLAIKKEGLRKLWLMKIVKRRKK
ncbi:hypothetical protein IAT40_002028 [Kwoniella sp. CBS 6097]